MDIIVNCVTYKLQVCLNYIYKLQAVLPSSAFCKAVQCEVTNNLPAVRSSRTPSCALPDLTEASGITDHFPLGTSSSPGHSTSTFSWLISYPTMPFAITSHGPFSLSPSLLSSTAFPRPILCFLTHHALLSPRVTCPILQLLLQ